MSDDDYPYNDDLLTTPSDQMRARAVYGPIAFALCFPQLQREVLEADKSANAAKRMLRRWGLTSIGMVTAALITASSAPLYHEYHPWSNVIVALAAISGVVGGLIGLGLFSAREKEIWLQNRLVTESLRQFHFRNLIALAPEILDAAASGDPLDFEANPTPAFRKFDEKRRAALDEFAQDWIRRKPEQLMAIVRPGAHQPIPEIHPAPELQVFERTYGDMILNAYGKLRIQRQEQYADHKLMSKGGLLSPFPRRQAAVLGGTVFACVFLLLGLHVVSAAVSTSELDQKAAILLDYLAVWTALVALALRTVEDGLKPHSEVERYLHYRATVERIAERFNNTDVAGKIAAAKAMERAAYDELAIFLRSHHEARFTM